jgi:cytochrome c553
MSLVAAIACVSVTNAWAQGDAKRGEDKAAKCVSCHGADGKGSGKNPPIAGLAADQFSSALKAFRDGSRASPMMGMVAKKLTDDDIADLAAYYSTR